LTHSVQCHPTGGHNLFWGRSSDNYGQIGIGGAEAPKSGCAGLPRKLFLITFKTVQPKTTRGSVFAYRKNQVAAARNVAIRQSYRRGNQLQQQLTSRQ